MKPANTSNHQQLAGSNSLDLPQPTIATLAPTVAQAPETRAASTDILAVIERNRIESLKRKQRSDSFLNKLTRPQLTKVLEWFDDDHDLVDVHQHITSPEPEGLGLQVDLSTLRRLRAYITATQSNCRATEILDTLLDMESAGDQSQSDRILSAINQLLHQKAFELARTAAGAPELFELLAAIERLSALDLKRQKIALDREKMLLRAQQLSKPRKHHVKLTITPAAPSQPQPPNRSGQQPTKLKAVNCPATRHAGIS